MTVHGSSGPANIAGRTPPAWAAPARVSRRRVIAGSAALATGPLLVACQGGLGGQQQARVTQDASGKVFIWWPNQVFDPATTVGGEVQRTFMQTYPKITLEWTIESNTDKLQTTVAAGTPPDLVKGSGVLLPTFGVLGVLTDLTDYVKRAGKAMRLDDVWPRKMQDLQWPRGVKTWGLSYSNDSRVIYMHVDHFTRAGIDPTRPPKLWPEFEATMPRLTVQPSPGEVTQFAFDPFFGSSSFQTWQIPFWQTGGDFLSADGRKVTIFEKGVPALEWCLKLLKMQGGWPALQRLQAQFNPTNKAFLAGKASYFHETFAFKAETMDKEAPGLHVAYMEFPLAPGGKPYGYSGGWSFYIPAGAKSVDAAWQFMEYLYTKDVELKWHLAHRRVPPHMSLAKSAEYLGNDPLLKLGVAGVENGRFAPAVPGFTEIRTHLLNMVNKVRNEQASPRESVAEAERLSQQELDKYANR